MAWLSRGEDEVKRFHPVFESEANRALVFRGIEDEYAWDHHPTDSAQGIPDFVLRDLTTDRWILSVELKRTPAAVWSPSSQQQAKGYAEANQQKFRTGWAKYYCVANLELFVLGALNADRPPRECVVDSGTWSTGPLGESDEEVHRDRISSAIGEIVDRALSDSTPQFDEVWPGILSSWLEHSDSFPSLTSIVPNPPTTVGWDLVSEFFAGNSDENARRVFLFRCLAAEYLRGTLIRYGHTDSNSIPPLRQGGGQVAATMNALSSLDFSAVFEPGSPEMYSTLTDALGRTVLNAYVNEVTRPDRNVAKLAASRVDAYTLLEALASSVVPAESQNESGKVQTDPELAAVLATFTIDDASRRVFDVACGDGSLIAAAHDRLRTLGASAQSALTQLGGIEADPISVRLAAMRLALKEPRVVSPTCQAEIVVGDAFASTSLWSDADVVLMNPPFKRYEDQSETTVPEELKAHFADAIRNLGGSAISTEGQANLYSYYVELLAASVADGAVIGIVLDNKWYHNASAKPLRQLLLDSFELLAIVEYPHSAFFHDWMISTSLLIARRVSSPDPDHKVRFVRCKVDPRSTGLDELSAAVHAHAAWPLDWTCRTKLQLDLSADVGWKTLFGGALSQDPADLGLPKLVELFGDSRRGSLEKEMGGVKVFDFPLNRTRYGPTRSPSASNGTFATTRGSRLTERQNELLRELSRRIPDEFLGYGLKNSSGLSGYMLNHSDVSVDRTFEPPLLRAIPELFRTSRRSRWTAEHDAALTEIADDPGASAYVEGVESEVGLTATVLSDPSRWVALREPTAGELIVPRKSRTGHRIHLNPYAADTEGRQVRLSSNFYTYGDPVSDAATNLDTWASAQLIASFLLSSFGHLQFEMAGYNREGMLAVEKFHVDNVATFDPRWIPIDRRQPLIDAMLALPYPIVIHQSTSAPERLHLDRLWSEEFAAKYGIDSVALIDDVHNLLDEYIVTRNP